MLYFVYDTSSGTDNGDSKHLKKNKVNKTSAFYLTSPVTKISTINKRKYRVGTCVIGSYVIGTYTLMSQIPTNQISVHRLQKFIYTNILPHTPYTYIHI